MSINPSRRKRQKLSDLIVEDVKRWIVTDKMSPGDKLPNERELIELFECSKGTVREALKALEVEGLVTTRTGPAGGAYLNSASIDPATRALRNYLHFQHFDSSQVYQLRRVIEVELAVAVIGHLSDEHFAVLEENIGVCDKRPETEEEQRLQRIVEIEFHNTLAEACPNPLLAFMARFLNDLLRDLVVLKKAYLPERHQFSEANVDYHRRILEAMKQEDEAKVRALMHEHMCDAERNMIALEGEMANRFLIDCDQT
ncbi:MAG: FCD domain-containing protein [Motiliproteus sp.]